MIDSFKGENRFLSSFWPCEVELDGVTYESVEHAYQAAKTVVPEEREKFRYAATAGIAKRLGRSVTMRDDWDDVKLSVMRDLVTQKFSDPSLRALLDETKGKQLIEGNHWGDVFWGVCKGKGENHLGKILMEVRDADQDN